MAIVVPFLGAAIGSAVGGTFLGVAAASWGWLGGSLLSSLLFKAPNQQGPRLQDLTITGTDYGQHIPWVAGSPRLAPTYVWVSTIREIANTQKVGKGGGQKVTQYTYECDIMLRLTENITEGVARDWVNSELVRNGLTLKDGLWGSVTVYTGESDQLPDPTYEAAVGAGNAPAYRGGTTIVITGLHLGNGKQLPNFEHQISDAEKLRTDLVFYASFDEGFGDLANPLVSPTIVDAAPTYVPSIVSGGFLGSALGYAGNPLVMTTARVEYSSSNYILGSDDFTISLRIKLSAYDPFGEAMVFELADTSNYLHNIQINTTPTGLQFSLSASQDFNVAIGLDQWYLVSVTRTSGLVKMWVDFDVVATNGSAVGSNTTRIRLLGNDSANRHPAALIDELAIVLGADLMTLGQVSPDDSIAYVGGHERLSVLLSALLLRSGFLPEQFEVDAELNQVVYGYATSSVTSTRAHLETLRPFGLYEANCSDKLYIFPRAETPSGNIPWEDLGVSETAGDPSDPFPLQVGNEIEVPAQIAVRYRNVSANWNVGAEFSDRLVSSREQSPQVVEMGFGMTPDQAKKVADTMLKDAMAGLGRATLRVGGRKHAKYEPGDILTTTAPNGTAYRFRIITKRDYIFMLEWEVALDDASALDSPAITYEGYTDTSNPLRVAPTSWEVMAIRPLRDADTLDPGPYVAVTPAKTGETDEWPGAVFVRARLPEAFEQQFISGDQCVMGECLTTLGDFSGGSGQVQRTGKLRVEVYGELASADYYDFFTDRTINAAVVGNEPIRFMTAEFISTDGITRVYDLYNFLRGQLGMEDQIAGHTSGERFVLLNNSIRRMVNETTDIDAEQQVKAVTLNLRLDDVTDENFTDDGIALRPLSPVRLIAENDGGDLDFTWIRRSRRVARWTTDGVICPLGEATEAYRVKVYDDPNADPVRTVDVTTQAWTYSSADQSTDGFTTADPITVTVQQLSEIVGEGDAATLETEAP